MILKFISSLRIRETILIAIGAAAVLGAVFASNDLLHAVQEAETFYSVGMNALSIEGDLQEYTQGSRRVFVYALTTKDPNVQLPYVNAARNADVDVTRLFRKISLLPLNSASKEEIAGFYRDWNRYLKVRNSVTGLILEDQPALAMEQERVEGAALFENCAKRLKGLKKRLDQNAQEELEAVRKTYYRCAVEVGFLIVTTILFIYSLRMLSGLKTTNQRLAESEMTERQRGEILEAISQNKSLDEILRSIAALVEKTYTSGLCVITLMENSIELPSARTAPESFSRLNMACRGAEVIDKMKSKWIVHIRAGKDHTVGSIEVYFPQQVTAMPEDLRLLERTGQLAGLAVEHGLVSSQLAFQAKHDGLTSLVNRAVLRDRIGDALKQANGDKKSFALLWIDLDRFKQVNDNLGHHIGDLLLQQVAQRLLACIRDSDTAARIGGDEFVILLPRCETSQLAVEIAGRIVGRLNEPVQAQQHTISVSGSLGISLYPEHGDDCETLLRNADTAMYAAKASGKNMFQIYESKMGVVSAETFEIDRQLRIALDGGGKLIGRKISRTTEFELQYQPQVNSSGTIESVEALLRWDSSVLGAVSPARFVPIAEENGVIVALGGWVLREACKQAAVWRRRGHDLRVAVNVSPHQFLRCDFPAAVKQALADNELPPELLELELTETAFVRNLDDIVGQFETIRQLGVRISIDDFGTGNSSLSYLRALPVDGLKIDRSFVAGIESIDRNTLPLVRAIVGMAHGLRLRVVAEGTETRGQLQILRREGCDLHQGYFLHRPVNAAGIDAILKSYPAGHPAFAHEPDTEDLVALSRVGSREISNEPQQLRRQA